MRAAHGDAKEVADLNVPTGAIVTASDVSLATCTTDGPKSLEPERRLQRTNCSGVKFTAAARPSTM